MASAFHRPEIWLGLCLPALPLEIVEAKGLNDGGSHRGATALPTNGSGFGDGSHGGSSSGSGNHHPGHSATALAITDARQILHVNGPARQRGVQPGMRRAVAQAIAPELRLIDRSFSREWDGLRRLALSVSPFTPTISLWGPGSTRHGDDGGAQGLLLEIASSLRLFRGLDTLVGRIRHVIEQQGVSMTLGIAPTPVAAWLLACEQRDRRLLAPAQLAAGLASLPLALFAPAHPHLDTLQAVGCRTLGDLERLPRPGIVRRFGQALLDELDRAHGRLPDPQPLFELPRRFDTRLELPASVHHAEALLFAARRLLLPLTQWLRALQAGTDQCALQIEHDGHPSTPLPLRTAEPTRDLDRLMSLLRERLAVTPLPAPAQALRLCCDDPAPLASATLPLFLSAGPRADSLGRLLETLQARLGEDSILRLSVVDDHRPEAAQRLDTLAATAATAATARGTNANTNTTRDAGPPRVRFALPRPLWLFEQPIVLHEHGVRPHWRGPLHLLAGPERIETGWWDGRLVQRDYFVAEDDQHAMYWIYRERVPDPASGSGWFMQGRYG